MCTLAGGVDVVSFVWPSAGPIKTFFRETVKIFIAELLINPRSFLPLTIGSLN